MCGICGHVSRKGITPDDARLVAAVNERLSHRGPDGAGDYQDACLALGMRRLSIIDVNGGWQPLYNEDRTLVLVANGEIYNYIELRERLEGLGHRFKTGSDCETILHLYEEFGLDCVNHLRGMFAFALWDLKQRRLVLARDRMGEKPLYLYERDGQLWFASELKALLDFDAVPFELDPKAVDLYFHYQYVPEPRTLLRGVRKLDAAHLLIVDVDDWRITERRYWNLEDAPPLSGEPARLIREQLEEASELVTRADVEVGVALSGGLDSSVVAALASRRRPGALHAFSVGYNGRPASDERAEAQSLAQQLGLPFHDVEIETREVVDFFPELNYWRDDPIADISGHGYYALMKLAREHHVPVMMQGQGGDELFWGYPLLQQAAHESAQKAAAGKPALTAPLLYFSLHPPARLSRQELTGWTRDLGGLRSGWQRWQRDRSAPSEQMVFYNLSPDFLAAHGEMRALYGQSFVEQLGESKAAELFTIPQPWLSVDVSLTGLICATYLRENGIAQGDRLSMASSVEMRLPLLDYKLVETIIGLRKTRTDFRLPSKTWLKEAVADVLPANVINRPKRGFAPPVREWHEAIFSAHGDSLRDGYLTQTDVLSREAALTFANGSFPAGATCPLSFKALVLEQWARQMLGRRKARAELSGERQFAQGRS
jgi:asparagine synthase (glutamine-hydrolysing)